MTNRVITRAGKGSPLLNSELDLNFTNLDRLYYYDQSLTNVSGTTGLILEDDTEFKFVPQMSPEYLVFIPATLTQEIQIHRDGNYGVYVQTDKKLRVNYGGSYTTVAPLAVSDDWVNIQFSYNDNETSAVTFDTNINGVAFGSQQVVTYSDEFIRSIWATDYGFLHIASMGYGFLTNAATTKTQNWGDAIGALRSVAGAAVTLAQATSTARPLIGRVPVGGRRNLLVSTNNLNGTGWTRNGVTVLPSTIVAPDGTTTADRIYPNSTGNAETGYIYCPTVNVSSISTGTISIAPAGKTAVVFYGATGATRIGYVNLTSGAVTIVAGTYTVTTSLEANGFYKITVTSPASANSGLLFAAVDAVGAIAVTANGTDGIAAWRPQLELGSTATAYQEVVTARNITESGILDQEYAFFDRADDILEGTIDAITSGEIIIAGRNGVWHDSLTVSAGTWQIGATTYTGGPAGILAVIGDFIFSAVIDGRAFTTEERDALYALAEERGAPGVFTLGAELVTNGTFDTDTSGWSSASFTLSLVGNALNAAYNAVTFGNFAGATSTLSAGVAHLMTYEIISASAASNWQLVNAANAALSKSVGARSIAWVQSSAATALTFYMDGMTSGESVTIDNISCKAITLTPWS